MTSASNLDKREATSVATPEPQGGEWVQPETPTAHREAIAALPFRPVSYTHLTLPTTDLG